jgi:hypothetical protein
MHKKRQLENRACGARATRPTTIPNGDEMKIDRFHRVRTARTRSLALGLGALASLAWTSTANAAGDPAVRVVRPPAPIEDVKLPAPPQTKAAVDEVPRFERASSNVAPAHESATKLPSSIERTGGFRRDPNAIYHSEGSDGAHWVRGASYKASFGAEGAQYIPFLGSAAPQSYPLQFSLSNASVDGQAIGFDGSAAATRQGDRIVYDRGTLLEVYDVAVGSIEQSFVFQSLPSSGELVLRIETASELEGAQAAEGLEFRTAIGGVRYGRATALDASGASIAAITTWTGSGIEIRVPAEFVASARFPLTVDPVLSSFSVDSTTLDDFLPDVAYDATNNRWLTVYEEVFSSTDHDVVYSLLTSTGALVSSGFVDGSLSAYWANPATANNDNANQFLVVAQVGLPSSGTRVIRGRTLAAGTATLGTDLLISTTDQGGDKLNPDVGGDNFGGTASYYGVVWERVFTSTDRDIHARCVSQTGTLIGTGTILIDNSSSTIDTVPSIAKGTGGIEWGVAWQRQFTLGDEDIRGAVMNWDGTINVASFSLDFSGSDDRVPDVSTRNSAGQYLVTYQRDFGDHDIEARLMNGSTSVDSVSLTGLEDAAGVGLLLQDQIRPSTDCDGNVFVVAYAESFSSSSTDYDPWVSTLSVISNQLHLSELHKNFTVGFSTTREDFPQVAAAEPSNGAVRRMFVVWHDAAGGSTLGNIEGGLYDAGQFTSFCHPGADGTIACPCGNPPSSLGSGCANGVTGGATLVCSGTSSLASDTMLMNSSGELATALSIFSQGNAVTNVVFGQGVRCAGGSLKRLYTKAAVGGAATAPTGGDADVHTRSSQLGDVIPVGTSRYYYVYYRQPTVLGGCPAASTFNATQTVATIWAP